MQKKYKAKFYTERGDLKHCEYGEDLYEVIKLYLKDKNPRYACRPTLWVLDDQHVFLDYTGYVRVHDFQFDELTPDTYNKYLDERVINTDDLLARIERR